MSGTVRKIAFVAGSGMNDVRAAMSVRDEVPFHSIDGVGACAIEGHAGCVIDGTIGGRDCTLVMGRRHFYEGEAAAVDALVAWLKHRGVTDLVAASAAGALHRGLEPGDVMVARDIIDFQNRDPQGARLRLDRRLSDDIERAATLAGVCWQRGTILCGSGPAYETRAEVRALQEHGDAATMSGVPELAAATRHGVRMAAVALITNPCTGVSNSRPNHLEVLEAGRRAASGLSAIIGQLVAMD